MSYQQQPFTQYPPPPPLPSYQPPPQKPSFWKRKVGCLPMWAIILIAVLACYAVGSAALYHPTTTITSVSTAMTPPAITVTALPTDTPLPTVAPAKWATTHTFTGSGNKKTAVFHVGNDWKILWKGNQGDVTANYGTYNLMVDVLNSDGTSADTGAINELVKTGNLSGETEEHQGGDVYLDIESESGWVVTVQEMK